MDGALGAGFPNTPDYERLDVSPLDLDEGYRSRADRPERFDQGGNPDAGAQGMRFHDVEVGVGDGDISGLRHTSRVEHGIVMNHNDAIARRVHIELDSLGAQLERSLEGWNRVFGQRFVRPAVGDPERWAAL